MTLNSCLSGWWRQSSSTQGRVEQCHDPNYSYSFHAQAHNTETKVSLIHTTLGVYSYLLCLGAGGLFVCLWVMMKVWHNWVTQKLFWGGFAIRTYLAKIRILFSQQNLSRLLNFFHALKLTQNIGKSPKMLSMFKNCWTPEKILSNPNHWIYSSIAKQAFKCFRCYFSILL